MTAFYDATQVMTDNFVVFRFFAINCTINTRHFVPSWNLIKTQKRPTARDMTLSSGVLLLKGAYFRIERSS